MTSETERTPAAGVGDGDVVFTRRGPVGHVELNRPHKRNAITPDMATLIESALRLIETEEDLAVGVISGRGGVAFSAGADLSYIAAGDGDRFATSAVGFAGVARLARSKPLIGAVQGYALAGGFEIALACDLLVAERSARFGLPEVQRGLIANGGGPIRLPARVPRGIALDVILAGRVLTAEEAAQFGIVTRLADDGEALSTAMELATRIATSPRTAVRASLQVVQAVGIEASDELWHLSRDSAAGLRAGAAAVHGAASFLRQARNKP